MGNAEMTIAKISQECTEIEADIVKIDALSARIVELAKELVDRSDGIALAMAWTK